MRHRKKNRKLQRKRDERRALLRSFAVSFILKEKISTTKAKADEVKRFVERLITLAKKQNLASYRLLISRLNNQRAAKKLYEEIAPKYKERKGGYTRIIKTAELRKRDGAELVILEFV